MLRALALPTVASYAKVQESQALLSDVNSQGAAVRAAKGEVLLAADREEYTAARLQRELAIRVAQVTRSAQAPPRDCGPSAACREAAGGVPAQPSRG